MPAPRIPIEVREFNAPSLEMGSAIMRTLYSEVCGTDVHLWHGRLAGVPYPIIPGHVAVGRLAAIRGDIHDIDGNKFNEGDLVTYLDVHETCNHCYHCLVARQPTRCPSRKVYGITYSASDGLLGGWSEAVWLQKGVKLVRVPESLPPETFIGGGCGLVTALHAVDRAAIRLGEAVAVLGVGPVGQSAVALAGLSGASSVIAIGAPDDRLEFARRMGATATISLDMPARERAATVRDLTQGRGADVVIEAAGAADAVSDALDMVRDGGRVVVCGQYTDSGDVSINPHRQINRKHVDLRGVWGSDYSHFHRAVQIAATFADRIPWGEMVTRRFGLDKTQSALEAVASRALVKAIVVPS
ncbi:MAG TPA: zinc-binding dehydrogenase [Gemmatimonadaceae bacterium]|nr:zinc-binding dehydrogenase [Gemmatimonadaceae bacterium]